MKRALMFAAMFAAFGLGGAAAVAATADKPTSPWGQSGATNDQVCPPGDSGKIDVSGGSSVTVTAPEGKLISGYCVKAGSENQGLGPEFVTVDPPQKTVTISHSSGKDVSHYSVTYVDEEPPAETTTTETTTTETTTTETTTTETTTTETTPTQTTQTETTRTETTPTTRTETTPTKTTPTETTPTETTSTATPTETTEATQENPNVFTPPTANQETSQVKSGSVAAPRGAARPSKAPQPAPFTP